MAFTAYEFEVSESWFPGFESLNVVRRPRYIKAIFASKRPVDRELRGLRDGNRVVDHVRHLIRFLFQGAPLKEGLKFAVLGGGGLPCHLNLHQGSQTYTTSKPFSN